MMLQQIVDIGQQMRVAIGETDAAVDGIQGRLLQFHTLSPLPLLLVFLVIVVAVIQCAIRAATVAATALA